MHREDEVKEFRARTRMPVQRDGTLATDASKLQRVLRDRVSEEAFVLSTARRDALGDTQGFAGRADVGGMSEALDLDIER